MQRQKPRHSHESTLPFKTQKSSPTTHSNASPTPQIAARALTENIFGQHRYPLHSYKEGRADLRGRRMAPMKLEWRFPIALVERGFMAPATN
jgi:hypothetical protein